MTLEFSNVFFAYPTRPLDPVLRGMSFVLTGTYAQSPPQTTHYQPLKQPQTLHLK
jgi:hypothetical protein